MKEIQKLSVGVLLTALLAPGGCTSGQGTGAAGGNEKAAVAEHGSPAAGPEPCQLLTGAQVATVLPGHDEGFVAKQGGSLLEGVDAYQCSYSDPSGNLLTVILNVAVDDDRFAKIKPSGFAMGGDARKLDVADGGWLRGEQDDMKVTLLKNHTVIDLELLAPDAGGKGDALVELARQVAAKVS